MAVTFWYWLGTIYLVLLTVQDFKLKGLVDDRRNWFMIGLTTSLFFYYHTRWYLLLLILGLALGLGWIMNRVKGLGSADIKTIMWSMYGFAIINILYMAFYGVMLASIYAGYIVVKRAYIKYAKAKDVKTPFYPVILMAYVITCLVFGVYI